jgi:hypothetical protein
MKMKMKKSTGYFLVTIFCLAILTFCSLKTQAQTIVSTIPENRNVILEEFTGIYCTYCPDGHLIAQNLHNANPNDVFLINIHTGGYANPNGPNDPDFNCLYGAAIAANSGLAGYPAGTVNRDIISYSLSPQGNPGTTALSRGDWATEVDTVLSQASYVNVGVQASYDMVTGILTVNTETYYTQTTTNINVLHVAVVQNNVPGPQTGALSYNPGAIITGPWSPTYNHQHMFRHLMDGANGLEFNVTTAGTFVPNTHTWQMPTNLASGQSTNGYFPDLDPTNLDVVAYIAEGPDAIITGYQANVIPIFPNAYDANVTNSTAEDVICESETDISITFRNYGNQPLTSLDLTYDINGGTPAVYNWTGNLISGAQETVTINSVTFTPQANNTVTWVASNPNGQVDQNTTNNSSTSTFKHFNLSGDVITGITAGTIDVSILTDGYGSETTWEIVDESGNVYGSGGPYSNNTQYNETAYVAIFPSCFELKLYDSYGDGMCCANGVGSVLVTDQNNNIIFEGDPVNLQNFSEISVYFETGMGSSNSWECTPFGCADVGMGNGSYATQFDCESDSLNVNTPCFVVTSINEIELSNNYNKIYDVLGREWKVQFGDLPKGIYIINNKIQYKQ